MSRGLRKRAQDEEQDSEGEEGQTQVGTGTQEEEEVQEEEEAEEEEEEDEVPKARRSKRKARATTADLEQQDDEDEEDGEAVSPKGSKRRRVSGEVKSETQNGVIDEEDEEENEDGETEQLRTDEGLIIKVPKRVFDRDAKGYVPGSIVRVAASHFVTYDAVEFVPGPRLNMIIGPNGTGKSTICCAIALGLGWNPGVLGRAKDISAFVKHGYTDGWIEVELKGRPNEPNLIIRRNITTEKNSSEYELNGERTTLKEVTRKVGELHIQIGNLCSFLPQDKVCEFAQMTPPQLLKETQKAAGNPRLSEWHQQLIEDRRVQRDLENNLNAQTASCESVESRNRANEADVRRYREKQDVQTQIDIYRLLIPFGRYVEAKGHFDILKGEKNRLQEEFNELEAENAPFLAQKEELHKQVKAAEKKKKNLQEKAKQNNSDVIGKFRALGKSEEDTEGQKTKLDGLKREKEKHDGEMRKVRDEIRKLEGEVANEPEQVDTAAITQQLNEVNAKKREIHARGTEIQDRQKEMVPRAEALESEKGQVKSQLRALEDVKQQRYERCRNEGRNGGPNANLLKAAQWITENRDKFEDKVFEPVRFELGVKEQRFAKVAEACVPNDSLRLIICKSVTDYDAAATYFNDQNNMRLNIVSLSQEILEADYSHPWSDGELHENGFDAWASDLLDGPEEILKFLCSRHGLHRVPVAFTSRQVNSQLIENPNCLVKSYVSGDWQYSINLSRYSGKAQIRSNQIRDATVFAQSVDPNRKRGLERRLEDIGEELGTMREKLTELGAQFEEAREEVRGYDTQKEELVQQKDAATRAIRAWNHKKVQLDQKRDRLLQLERMPSEDERRSEVTKKLRQCVEKRKKLASEHKTLIVQGIDINAHLSKQILEQLQADSNLAAMDLRNTERSRNLAAIRRNLDTAVTDMQRARATAQEIIREAQAGLAEAQATNAEVHQEVQRIQTTGMMPLEELEKTLAEYEASLNLIKDVSEGTVRLYEQREKEIKDFKRQIERLQKQLNAVTTRLVKTKDKWLPALEALVGTVSKAFSKAFDRMGCVGEVQIGKDEDFDKWSIDIMVSFRDGEPMQHLTGQRQSGGERSLATILYLMSLMELARAPFSLVDEINQGMDQRAERAVHNQLVEVTCNENSAQTFLITPKLLPGLRYDKHIKILCINNGEWLPDKFSFRDTIDRKLKSRGLTSVSAASSVRVH